MSDFAQLLADDSLWDPVTICEWESNDFCHPLPKFSIRTISHSQLLTLYQAGAWSNPDKLKLDMVFLLILPYILQEQERFFGLVVVWAHPHQTCFHTLEEAAHWLMLLINDSADWAYAFAHLNGGPSYTSLSSEGHVSAMTGGMPPQSTCGRLHQLQAWHLLQHSKKWFVLLA